MRGQYYGGEQLSYDHLELPFVLRSHDDGDDDDFLKHYLDAYVFNINNAESLGRNQITVNNTTEQLRIANGELRILRL